MLTLLTLLTATQVHAAEVDVIKPLLMDATGGTQATPTKARVHEPADRGYIYGLLGLESELYQRDIDVRDVHVVSTDIAEEVIAPNRSIREYRWHGWKRHFGGTVLKAQRANLHDGVATRSAEEAVPRGVQDFGGKICVKLDRPTEEPWELATWDDATRGQTSSADIGRRATTPPLFLADTGAGTTALVHLAPGESVTLVELDQQAKRHQKKRRRLTVKNGERELTLAETDEHQSLCIDLEPQS